MFEKEYDWACEAAKKIGWLPQVIFSHWALETGWFKSNNYIQNKNIAGQTWNRNYNSLEERGTPRPLKEGGYYIKYSDPVKGYVEFINRNQRRYGGVKHYATVEEQFRAIKSGGWAVDPNYVSKLLAVYRSALDKGVFVRPVVKRHTSLVDFLKGNNRPSDFVSRRKLAEQHGITHYTGTAEQNITLLKILQS